MLWPGSGKMVDAGEKAALVDFYRSTAKIYPFRLGSGGTAYSIEEFLADPNLDPCIGDGSGKRAPMVVCSGGHVVALVHFGAIALQEIPQSFGALTQLRYIIINWGLETTSETLQIPCKFGQLSNLVSFIVRNEIGVKTIIQFPDHSCFAGLSGCPTNIFGDENPSENQCKFVCILNPKI